MSAATSMTADRRPGASAPARLRCRAIRQDDGAALVRLLARGFPNRTTAYWTQAIGRLLAHAAALAVPGCGTLLECDGEVVGVLLLVPGADAPHGTPGRRCNVSSWYVDPRFGAYAAPLVNQALRRADLTFFNISPAPHTWPTIEAQGFLRYSRGRVLALPALLPWRRGVRVQPFDPACPGAGIDRAEADLLARHVGYGCIALVARRAGGDEPFLFLPWRVRGKIPAAQLVYCRDVQRFVELGGVLGRALLRRGLAVVTVDACGPVHGLPGLRVADRSPKYARGPDVPRTGDLTDTELVMFGP